MFIELRDAGLCSVTQERWIEANIGHDGEATVSAAHGHALHGATPEQARTAWLLGAVRARASVASPRSKDQAAAAGRAIAILRWYLYKGTHTHTHTHTQMILCTVTRERNGSKC